MKVKRIMMVMAVVAVSVLVVGGESFARRGGGAVARGGLGLASQTEGSQRRDGTFLSTGTTANGSTTRPGNGFGVMDGTGINCPATTAPTTTTP